MPQGNFFLDPSVLPHVKFPYLTADAQGQGLGQGLGPEPIAVWQELGNAHGLRQGLGQGLGQAFGSVQGLGPVVASSTRTSDSIKTRASSRVTNDVAGGRSSTTTHPCNKTSQYIPCQCNPTTNPIHTHFQLLLTHHISPHYRVRLHPLITPSSTFLCTLPFTPSQISMV